MSKKIPTDKKIHDADIFDLLYDIGDPIAERLQDASICASNIYADLRDQGLSNNEILKYASTLMISYAVDQNDQTLTREENYQKYLEAVQSARTETTGVTANTILKELERGCGLWDQYGHYTGILDSAIQSALPIAILVGAYYAAPAIPATIPSWIEAASTGLSIGSALNAFSIESLAKSKFSDFYNPKAPREDQIKAFCELVFYDVHIDRARNERFKQLTDDIIEKHKLPLHFEYSPSDWYSEKKSPFALVKDSLKKLCDEIVLKRPNQLITEAELKDIRQELMQQFNQNFETLFAQPILENLREQQELQLRKTKEKDAITRINNAEKATMLSLKGAILAASILGAQDQTTQKMANLAIFVKLGFNIVRFAFGVADYASLIDSALTVAQYIVGSDSAPDHGHLAFVQAQYKHIESEVQILKFTSFECLFELKKLSNDINSLRAQIQHVQDLLQIQTETTKRDKIVAMLTAHRETCALLSDIMHRDRYHEYNNKLMTISDHAVLEACSPAFNLSPTTAIQSRRISVDYAFPILLDIIKRFNFQTDTTLKILPNLFEWCRGVDFFIENYLSGLNHNSPIIFNTQVIGRLDSLKNYGSQVQILLQWFRKQKNIKQLIDEYTVSSEQVLQRMIFDFETNVNHAYEYFLRICKQKFGATFFIDRNVFLTGPAQLTAILLKQRPYVPGMYELIRNAKKLQSYSFIDRTVHDATKVNLYTIVNGAWNPYLAMQQMGIIQIDAVSSREYRHDMYYYITPIKITITNGAFAGISLMANKIERALWYTPQIGGPKVDHTIYDFASINWREPFIGVCENITTFYTFLDFLNGTFSANLESCKKQAFDDLSQDSNSFPSWPYYIKASTRHFDATLYLDIIAKLNIWCNLSVTEPPPVLDFLNFTISENSSYIYIALLKNIFENYDLLANKKRAFEAELSQLFAKFAQTRQIDSAAEEDRTIALVDNIIFKLSCLSKLTPTNFHTELRARHAPFLNKNRNMLYAITAGSGIYTAIVSYTVYHLIRNLGVLQSRKSHFFVSLIIAGATMIASGYAYATRKTAMLNNLIRSGANQTEPQKKQALLEQSYLSNDRNVYILDKLARYYNEKGEHTCAENLYKEAITKHPHNALVSLSHDLFFNIPYDIKTLIDKILGYSPSDNNHLALAMLYYESGDEQNAIKSLEKIKTKELFDGYIHYWQGLCFLQSNEKEEALKQFLFAVENCQYRKEMLLDIKTLLTNNPSLNKQELIEACEKKLESFEIQHSDYQSTINVKKLFFYNFLISSIWGLILAKREIKTVFGIIALDNCLSNVIHLITRSQVCTLYDTHNAGLVTIPFELINGLTLIYNCMALFNKDTQIANEEGISAAILFSFFGLLHSTAGWASTEPKSSATLFSTFKRTKTPSSDSTIAAPILDDTAAYRYIRFTPLDLRGNIHKVDAVQMSLLEIKFQNQVIPGATVTNPSGRRSAIQERDENPRNVLDGNLLTKWIDLNKGPLILDFHRNIRVDAYTWATANDCPERDPMSWQLEGSGDGTNWKVLDSRTNSRDNNVSLQRNTRLADFNLPLSVAPEHRRH
ncbi:MAG: discoidin domain-containing protein [Proteobacteria bacterium]|nr:discoidin domain-containing protein [Pseudomonadota bacterium]